MQLKSCPFCGGEAETFQFHGGNCMYWTVNCQNCHALLNGQFTKEEAEKMWNTRKREDTESKVHAHAIIDWLGNCKCSNCATSIDITGKYCHFCGARLDEPEQYEN